MRQKWRAFSPSVFHGNERDGFRHQLLCNGMHPVCGEIPCSENAAWKVESSVGISSPSAFMRCLHAFYSLCHCKGSSQHCFHRITPHPASLW